MSEEFLTHIFEPFSQDQVDARSVRRGTGLGMTIVKGLIEQMDGTISIPSQLGAGSTFVICIPFETGEKPEAKPEADASAASIQGLRLLLAEDNELKRGDRPDPSDGCGGNDRGHPGRAKGGGSVHPESCRYL